MLTLLESPRATTSNNNRNSNSNPPISDQPATASSNHRRLSSSSGRHNPSYSNRRHRTVSSQSFPNSIMPPHNQPNDNSNRQNASDENDGDDADSSVLLPDNQEIHTGPAGDSNPTVTPSIVQSKGLFHHHHNTKHAPIRHNKLSDENLLDKDSLNSDEHDGFLTAAPYLPDEWLADFSARPTWCDAKMTLTQIKRGKATGSKLALYPRRFQQLFLFTLGRAIQKFWPVFLLLLGFVLSFFVIQLRNVVIQTDIVKLWVEDNGDLVRELNFLGEITGAYVAPTRPKTQNSFDSLNGTEKRQAGIPDKPPTTTTKKPKADVTEEEVSTTGGAGRDLNGGFTLFIQTPKSEGLNVLTTEDLMLHADLLLNISRLSVRWGGYDWRLEDLCFKPPSPQVTGLGFLNDFVQPVIDKIIPCILITPLDCFWEGSKPLGPNPPIFIPFVGAVGTRLDLSIQTVADLAGDNIPTGYMDWTNLEPQMIIEAAIDIIGDLGLMGNQLSRAGLGDGYQSRPCIDNLDEKCPLKAPNAINWCGLIEEFIFWNDTQTDGIQLVKEDVKKSRTELFKKTNSHEKRDGEDENDDYYAAYEAGYEDYGDPFDFGGETEDPFTDDPRPQSCRQYITSMRQLMRSRPDVVKLFVANETLRKQLAPELTQANYGEQLTGGCKGFARNILGWPEDLIVGGIKRDGNGTIIHAESYQSVMLLGGPHDIHSRYVNGFSTKPGIEKKRDWTPGVAGAILGTWQRKFTKFIFDHHTNNDDDDLRQSHPLAGTSISDMMEKFSQFKYGTILTGYAFMFLYAGFVLFSFGNNGVDSAAGLAFVGVILVTIASAAGLGLSTMMKIEFNAVTTQIVPFLALGLGVDDMFLLVHNYKEIVSICHNDELGFLLKETGLSVMLTSISNILAFLAGSLLPIPAMRNFCLQTAILLTFNVIVILTGYPAIMAIDLIRRKHGLVDILCCIRGKRPSTNQHTADKNTTVIGQDKGHNRMASDGIPRDGHYHKLPVIYGVASPNLSAKDAQSSATLQLQGAENAAIALDTRQPTGHSPPPPYPYENGNGKGLVGAVQSDSSSNKSTAMGRFFEKCSMAYFVHHYYIPMLQMKSSKIVVMVLSLVMCILGVIGALRIELGLELSDVIPTGTPEHEFLLAREQYFSFYPMYAVIRSPTDLPNKQREMQNFRNEILDMKYTVTGNSILAEEYWYTMFRNFTENLNKELAQMRADKTANATWVDPKATEKQKLTYAMVNSVGYNFNGSRFMDPAVQLVYPDENPKVTEVWVNREAFYNYVTAWFHSETMMYYVSQGALFPPPPAWALDPKNPYQLVEPSQPLNYSQIPFFLNGLVATPSIVDMIHQTRDICERYTANEGLYTFPQGIPFTFWHQYLALKWNLAKSLLIISGAVFLVISLLLMNPWTGACVLAVLLINLIELAGFMGLTGLKLNPVSAVTVIVAVGIGVEFTVHVSLSYLTALGTPNERLARTLDHMFLPVVHGGISTFLGIIMLAFSEFEFIILYFFLVMCALVVLGMFNGLALLPVVLALFGPPTEVKPLDGGNYLEPPVEQMRGSTHVNKTLTNRPLHNDNGKTEMHSMDSRSRSRSPTARHDAAVV